MRTTLTENAWIKLQDICYLTDNYRNTFEGILWLLRTVAPWRDLLAEFGPWYSIYRRYNRWNKNGRVDEILENVEGIIDYRTVYLDSTDMPVHQHATDAAPKGTDKATGISRAGLTPKIHAAVNCKGISEQFEVNGGNISDKKKLK